MDFWKNFKKKFSKNFFSVDNSNKQQKSCNENVDGRFFRCSIILSITFDYGGILFWCYSHSRYLYSQLFTRLQRNDFKIFHTRGLHSLIRANAITKRCLPSVLEIRICYLRETGVSDWHFSVIRDDPRKSHMAGYTCSFQNCQFYFSLWSTRWKNNIGHFEILLYSHVTFLF